jgi:hypothetical protein
MKNNFIKKFYISLFTVLEKSNQNYKKCNKQVIRISLGFANLYKFFVYNFNKYNFKRNI